MSSCSHSRLQPLSFLSLATAVLLVFAIAPPTTAQTASDPETIPSAFPAFTPDSDADYSFDKAVTDDYSNTDHTSPLVPSERTRTHVKFDNGTLTPSEGSTGIVIDNDNSDTE